MKTVYLMIQLTAFTPSTVPATKVILIPYRSAVECVRVAKTVYAAYATGQWSGRVDCVQYMSDRRDE